ncbi:MotA/TolQ/ExbB proton channel family protein [Marinospirillum sp.]|uniref:MotA/TolQ/ExbB proton channel family protein n=1 Tax=Marinospirillum sp. TaxID=2183934 RepID=UPI003A8419C8
MNATLRCSSQLSLLVLFFFILMAPQLAAQTPEDYWQSLLLDTRAAALERQLVEEARLQLQQQAATTQAQALHQAEHDLAAAEQEQQRLNAEQQALESQLSELQEVLQRRSASLGEVFAVYTEEKGNFYGLLADALVTQQQPELRSAFRPQSGEAVPDIEALEKLWQGLQQAWIASAQAVRFSGSWVDPAGHQQDSQLLRLGDLQLMNQQGLLQFKAGQLPQLWSRQPSGIERQVTSFLAGEQDSLTFDPARGLTLRLLSHQPSVLERIQQGGQVAYLILFLGALGLVIAGVQSVRLLAEGRRVRRQLLELDKPIDNNALGRVLLGLHRETVSASTHPEGLEARMDELLLREAAALERGLSWVKLLAAIAPLLGLLGTVTGMIVTFQAITLFGTGDPGMMAGGISQALVTTVLGLVTAVPLLLAHLLLQGRSRYLARTLEAETSGWLATCLAQPVSVKE